MSTSWPTEGESNTIDTVQYDPIDLVELFVFDDVSVLACVLDVVVCPLWLPVES